jgi:predicted O-methyltransferase YrrM
MGWFTKYNAKTTFEQLFLPLAGDDLGYLEIGVWKGDSLRWMLENVLTSHGSRAVAIDPWTAMLPKHPQTAMDEVARVAMSVDEPYGKTHFIRQQSVDALQQLVVDRCGFPLPGGFDIAYIDGDHSAHAALSDLVMVFPLVKPGGFIVCDDFDLKKSRTGTTNAIDAFLDCFHSFVEEIRLDQSQQWACRKISEPTPNVTVPMRPRDCFRYAYEDIRQITRNKTRPGISIEDLQCHTPIPSESN